MSRKHVLICSMYFAPEPTGIAPMATDLARDLSENGWDVSVLTAFPMMPGWEVYPEYKRLAYMRERMGNVDVIRTWAYVPKRPESGVMKTWRRIAFDSSIAFTSLPATVAMRRPDVIVAIGPPLQVGIAALAMKARWKTPVLYWLQDIVPDAAVNVGMMRPGIALGLARALERFVYRGVDKIAIISEGFERNLMPKGVSTGRMTYLPNWANLGSFDAVSESGDTRAAELAVPPGHFVLMHSGSVGAKQCLENAVRAMKLLENSGDVHLVVVGDGNRIRAVEAEVKKLNVPRVRFVPTTVGAPFIRLLRAADAHLINQGRNVVDALIPSKLMTYLPSGRPVIAAVHPASEAARFVKRADCGVVVEPENPAALADAVTQLKNDSSLRDRFGAAGARYIRQEYDKPVLMARFRDELSRLSSEPRA
jgi:colanic acid biosynthesis glycosyl transferase WcaI